MKRNETKLTTGEGFPQGQSCGCTSERRRQPNCRQPSAPAAHTRQTYTCRGTARGPPWTQRGSFREGVQGADTLPPAGDALGQGTCAAQGTALCPPAPSGPSPTPWSLPEGCTCISTFQTGMLQVGQGHAAVLWASRTLTYIYGAVTPFCLPGLL